jgi:hypothetical protein
MPIVRETDSDSSSVSSSSENVPPKGANFEEERTYSKASRNISPTFGFGDNDAKWSTRFLDRKLYVKDLHGWCRNHGKGGVYAHDTIRPAIREKIPTLCQGLYDAAQKLGKTAYLCDSHAQDPSLVRIVCVLHFPVETDNSLRPFSLNARGEFENPSLKSVADLFIGCMIAHGCDPGVAKNLVYGGLLGVVDALPLMGPHDWLSWKCRHFRCRPQLVLTTWCRVFLTRRPDTADVSATSCDVGFFFSVSYVVSLPYCRCRGSLKMYSLKLIQKIL